MKMSRKWVGPRFTAWLPRLAFRKSDAVTRYQTLVPGFASITGTLDTIAQLVAPFPDPCLGPHGIVMHPTASQFIVYYASPTLSQRLRHRWYFRDRLEFGKLGTKASLQQWGVSGCRRLCPQPGNTEPLGEHRQSPALISKPDKSLYMVYGAILIR